MALFLEYTPWYVIDAIMCGLKAEMAVCCVWILCQPYNFFLYLLVSLEELYIKLDYKRFIPCRSNNSPYV